MLRTDGISWEVIRSLDPRQMNAAESSVAIAIGAMMFTALEVLCYMTLRPALLRYLCPHGVGPTKKDMMRAEKNVTGGVVRAVSMVHNLIQIPVAFLVLLDPALQQDTIYGANALSSFMVLCSSSYFFYDLLQVLYRIEQEGLPMLVHAACCLFVYGYAVYAQYLHFFGAGFLLWELSTPFVHLRWLMFKGGREQTKLYLINGMAMILVFFLCRPLWGTAMSIWFFKDTEVELHAPRPNGFPPSGIWGYRIANVALNLLNYLWFYKMVSIASGIFFPKKGMKASKGASEAKQASRGKAA